MRNWTVQIDLDWIALVSVERSSEMSAAEMPDIRIHV